MCKPYTKEEQLKKNRLKPKKEAMFGKRPNKGSFGKKPYVAKTKNKKPKEKKHDLVDDKYSKWLGQQPCCISGIVAQRGIGINNIHCHHIKGRTPVRNDYEQVPLIGWLHSWGGKAYHENTKKDFIEKNMVMTDDIIQYFKDLAKHYNEMYVEQGGIIKQKELNL